MEWVKRMWRRARLLARRSAAERAMRLELDHHIACEIADRITGGMTRPGALEQDRRAT